jgi:hypothetical protein
MVEENKTYNLKEVVDAYENKSKGYLRFAGSVLGLVVFGAGAVSDSVPTMLLGLAMSNNYSRSLNDGENNAYQEAMLDYSQNGKFTKLEKMAQENDGVEKK